jgi:hypothetical protein
MATRNCIIGVQNNINERAHLQSLLDRINKSAEFNLMETYTVESLMKDVPENKKIVLQFSTDPGIKTIRIETTDTIYCEWNPKVIDFLAIASIFI